MLDDVTQSTNELNDILRIFQIGSINGKMSFNPDKSKQAHKVIFSRKTQRVIHPPVIFNNIPVAHSSCQKHLGIYLDEKLHFSNHIKEKYFKSKQRYRYPKEIVQCPT